MKFADAPLKRAALKFKIGHKISQNVAKQFQPLWSSRIITFFLYWDCLNKIGSFWSNFSKDLKYLTEAEFFSPAAAFFNETLSTLQATVGTAD